MALSPAEIKQAYPIPSYNYKVTINGVAVAFSQVSGLSMSFETSTYKESPVENGQVGPITMRMPAQHSDVSLTLQKGIVIGKSWVNLFAWINSTQLNQIEKRDISIDLMDEGGNAIVRWTVINAFPTSLEAPTFDASSNDAAIESLQLMADRIIMEEI